MFLFLAALLATPIHYSADPNYCVDLPAGTTSNGAPLQLYKCNGTTAQDWTVAATPTTTVPVAPVVSNAPSVPNSTTMVDPGTPAKAGYHAVFSDEFNDATLNLNKWNLTTDGSGGGNNELEYYVSLPANHFLSNSNLTLRVIKQSYLGQQYTSAKLTTLGIMDFTHGWVEARIKVPRGQGLWPAFWLLPKDNLYGTWPTSGELDIMEILGGSPNVLYGTAHFGPAWPNQLQLGGTQTLSGTDFSQDFHTFAIDWQANHVDWYCDGIKYFSMKDTDGNWQTAAQGAPVSTESGGWPFDKPFYVILNMAMGGQWPGAPDASIQQADLVFDYVRVYQQN